LTISSPLNGTSFNGSAATTIALASNYGDTQNPYASKTANFFLAAPNGSAGVPTFRAIVSADIPAAGSNTQVQYNNSGAFGASSSFTFDGTNLNVSAVTVGTGKNSSSTNSALGYAALSKNTADNNTGVGAFSLTAITSGGYNTAIGSGTLVYSQTGNRNTAVGYNAAYFMETGINNTAIGAETLSSVTVGTNNTGVGKSAGAAIYGNYNTAVGTNAFGFSSVSGTYNTGIGVNAGNAGLSGSYNVLLGGFTGAQGLFDITAASNYIVISDGAGNSRGIYNASGVPFFTQGSITSKAAAATLTGAEVMTQILNTTGTSYTITMPTGTALETAMGPLPSDMAFTFTVINTASGTVTIAVNTGITSIGTLTVLTGISARFTIRKTGINTYVMYRT
jgi:hypothetical protein